MPEGHTIHRAARDQRPHLAGRVVGVSSPQGRFAQGAGLLDGRICLDVEAYGKHLLYPFEGDLHLHLHLGLFGRIRTAEGDPPDPRGQVRLRLRVTGFTVDVAGPTACQVFDAEQRRRLLARLGPDPLRADADPEAAWAKIHRSRTSIGQLLMDQSVVSGIGNIYRCELLWRARLHPRLPGRDLSHAAWRSLWSDAKALLEIGVETGMILTTDGPAPRTKRSRRRFNIYKKAHCPRCRTPTTRFVMAGRNVFCCDVCAPPPQG